MTVQLDLLGAKPRTAGSLVGIKVKLDREPSPSAPAKDRMPVSWSVATAVSAADGSRNLP